jgi:hypothetical protein
MLYPEVLLTSTVGTVHLGFSDFLMISPYFARKMGSKTRPDEMLDEVVEVSRDFLSGSAARLGGMVGQPAKDVGSWRIDVHPQSSARGHDTRSGRRGEEPMM